MFFCDLHHMYTQFPNLDFILLRDQRDQYLHEIQNYAKLLCRKFIPPPKELDYQGFPPVNTTLVLRLLFLLHFPFLLHPFKEFEMPFLIPKIRKNCSVHVIFIVTISM